MVLGRVFWGEVEDRDRRIGTACKSVKQRVGGRVGVIVAATVRVWFVVVVRSMLATSLQGRTKVGLG